MPASTLNEETDVAPPKEMDDVLLNLPLRIGTYVPDDLLEDWFAPEQE